jgi:hypothetical protein
VASGTIRAIIRALSVVAQGTNRPGISSFAATRTSFLSRRGGLPGFRRIGLRRNAWNAYRAALQELAYSLMHKLPVSEFSQLYGQTFIEGYILAWPLIVACSIKTGNKDSSFHPQYLVPQMLLQWVCDEQKVDGIRYFSTRTPRGGFPYYNFAFPARVIKSEGRCATCRRSSH